ncbi:MAG TPA: DUF86 domain-containing protein, partial [Candidatus Sulfomarinibacteraceae bacterium]|nr:DUF86 domain-containing protein [Candidatus Sulfomarinibacteraceae bacterium]
PEVRRRVGAGKAPVRPGLEPWRTRRYTRFVAEGSPPPRPANRPRYPRLDGRHASRPLAALDEWDELRVVERGLQLCAQNALGIATHPAAGAGRDVPDWASSVDVLAVLGIVPRRYAARFRSVAGFRNILVHGYLEIDREILHEVLNTRLTQFGEFADHVESHLENG